LSARIAVAQLAQPVVDHLGRALARPLERGVRLGHEAADRDRAADVLPSRSPRGPAAITFLARSAIGEHVLVGLGRQPAHEVQLHLPPAGRVGGRDGADQVLLGDHLVDHLAHPLGAALGRERQARALAVAGQLVGQVDVEGVDAGGRQREPEVCVPS
jgi:hypothetical protein